MRDVTGSKGASPMDGIVTPKPNVESGARARLTPTPGRSVWEIIGSINFDLTSANLIDNLIDEILARRRETCQ